MSQDKTPVSPQITAGDIVVKVGPISWRGVKAIRDRILGAKLSPPSFEFASGQKNLALLTLDDFADLAKKNFSILGAWAASHPEIVDLLIVHGSNVPADKIDDVAAHDVLAIAFAVAEASDRAGLWENYARFFAGLLAPVLRALAPVAQRPPSDTASEAGGEPTTSTTSSAT